MDTSVPDQIWFKLSFVAGVLFGCCYVPPSDSPYFSLASFSSIQAKIKMSEYYHKGCVIIGDLNARFGSTVRELPVCIDAPNISYPDLPDPVRVANDNANAMFGICVEENMVLVNNLKFGDRSFPSGLTLYLPLAGKRVVGVRSGRLFCLF